MFSHWLQLVVLYTSGLTSLTSLSCRNYFSAFTSNIITMSQILISATEKLSLLFATLFTSGKKYHVSFLFNLLNTSTFATILTKVMRNSSSSFFSSFLLISNIRRARSDKRVSNAGCCGRACNTP